MTTTIDRRKIVQGLAGAGAVLALPGCVSLPPELDRGAIGEASLRERADRKGLLVGTAVGLGYMRDRYQDAVLSDCNIIVTENALKWESIDVTRRHRGEVQRYSFGLAEHYLDFADAHGMAFRGHALLWHRQVPRWLEGYVTDGNARAVLTQHIRTVAGHFAGRLHSWDVINEPIEPQDGRGDGLRRTLWLRHIGPEYVALAFRTASEADPNAMLTLNDYDLERDRRDSVSKRHQTLRLLEGLLSAGVPIHAVGIQGHLRPDRSGWLDDRALRDFCREVADLGLKIMVTELDATDSRLASSVEYRDRVVADAYARFLEIVLEQPATVAVLTWGLSDGHSWLSRHYPRQDGQTVRGCPYDEDLRRKPAWYAMASAIDQAAPRPGA